MSLHLPSLYAKCHIFISDSQIQLPTQHLHLDASHSSQILFVLNEVNELLTLHLLPLSAGLPWSSFWGGVVREDKINMTEHCLKKKKTFQEVNCRTPLKFFAYFKYSRKTFDILIHLNLQFPFPTFSQWIFKMHNKSFIITNKWRKIVNGLPKMLLLAILLMQMSCSIKHIIWFDPDNNPGGGKANTNKFYQIQEITDYKMQYYFMNHWGKNTTNWKITHNAL